MATGRGMLSNLLVLHEELEELIGDVLGVRARAGRANSWSPAADVFVLKDTLVVRFELAGQVNRRLVWVGDATDGQVLAFDPAVDGPRPGIPLARVASGKWNGDGKGQMRSQSW